MWTDSSRWNCMGNPVCVSLVRYEDVLSLTSDYVNVTDCLFCLFVVLMRHLSVVHSHHVHFLFFQQSPPQHMPSSLNPFSVLWAMLLPSAYCLHHFHFLLLFFQQRSNLYSVHCLHHVHFLSFQQHSTLYSVGSLHHVYFLSFQLCSTPTCPLSVIYLSFCSFSNSPPQHMLSSPCPFFVLPAMLHPNIRCPHHVIFCPSSNTLPQWNAVFTMSIFLFFQQHSTPTYTVLTMSIFLSFQQCSSPKYTVLTMSFFFVLPATLHPNVCCLHHVHFSILPATLHPNIHCPHHVHFFVLPAMLHPKIRCPHHVIFFCPSSNAPPQRMLSSPCPFFYSSSIFLHSTPTYTVLTMSIFVVVFFFFFFFLSFQQCSSPKYAVLTMSFFFVLPATLHPNVCCLHHVHFSILPATLHPIHTLSSPCHFFVLPATLHPNVCCLHHVHFSILPATLHPNVCCLHHVHFFVLPATLHPNVCCLHHGQPAPADHWLPLHLHLEHGLRAVWVQTDQAPGLCHQPPLRPWWPLPHLLLTGPQHCSVGFPIPSNGVRAADAVSAAQHAPAAGPVQGGVHSRQCGQLGSGQAQPRPAEDSGERQVLGWPVRPRDSGTGISLCHFLHHTEEYH